MRQPRARFLPVFVQTDAAAPVTLPGMTDSASLAWWHLGILNARRREALLQVYPDLPSALAAMDESMLTALRCRPETVRSALDRRSALDLSALEATLRARGITVIALGEAAYPPRLAQVADPPVFLSVRGDPAVLQEPSIALVGTRAVSAYGKRVTERLVPDMAAAGAVTVSGLALGVDALVAEETLKAGGRTVAVLGHGLGSIYPRSHAALAERIVAAGGALVSEFPLDQRPDTYTFPARNRIVAGLTLGTVVLEAPQKSGSLITAEIATGYGREVFAVPGAVFDPHYAGCHRLIRSGQAQLITSAGEVLASLGFAGAAEAPAGPAFIPQDPEQARIHALLTAMPQPLDDLVARSGMETGALNALLTVLELQGGARNLGGGQWVRG